MLLRCFEALSTSSIRCFTLRSSCPTPFVQLVALLYSDKKPGEVVSRQLIFAILLICILPGHRLSLYLLPKMALLFQEAIAAENLGCELENSLGMSNLKPSHRLYFINFIRALLLTPAPHLLSPQQLLRLFLRTHSLSLFIYPEYVI